MPDDVRERELKFDVPDTWSPPDVTPLVPAGGRVETVELSLASEYFDTDDRVLLACGVTLRRRTGGAQDTGWQLKIPDGDARLELREALGPRGVPERFRRVTAGLRGRGALRPVATIRTERTARRVLDFDGVQLAEIVDDAVLAHTVREFAVTRSWDEVEVELAPAGSEKLLRHCADLLTSAGAGAPTHGSKLARALGTPVLPARGTESLADVVAAYLDAQFAALVHGDVRLRDAGPGPLDTRLVHRTRVATRRYRSVLRVFAAALDPDRARWLDAELRWYAEALGHVRDRHVLRGHLLGAVQDLPSSLVVGPVAAIVTAALDADEAAAREELQAVLEHRRHVALLAELRAWRQDPPFVSNRPADDVDRHLRRARATVRKRLRRARRTNEDEDFHRARKAAKRARYTAELAAPVSGPRAERARRRAKALQNELGGRQDDVMAAQFLHRLAVTSGADGFTLGVLYQRERDAVR